ncbi:phage tail tape measure protein [Clostridium sp. BJN0013]|uniref:phage tail tape measure protein n=1 Tax=Clostridium sp. BJN0013 TaxID=3236840 RepID=UPI0034C6D227
MDSTNRKIANFKLTSLSASLKESGERFKTVGDTAGRMGDTLLMLSAPLVGIGVAAGKVGIDFETSMSQASGALNKPISQMGSLRELALKTGADTQFSATEAGNAITELAKGGLTEAQIKTGALDATMKLAASSGMQLGDAANTIVQAMGAFGLSAGQASEAANALAGAAAASSTDVEPLTEGLAQCSAQANLAGWSIQDTTAALGAFADRGVVGSDAGTSLKTALQRLGAPTDEAAAKMKELGINVWDGSGHMKDAAGIAQELQTHMGKLSDSSSQSAMSIIFGSDATRAASILMSNGAEGIQKYTKATNDQTSASRLANTQMGETQKAIEQMKGSLEATAIKLEENFAPTIKSIADTVGKLADAFGNLSPGTQKLIVDFTGVTVAAGATLKVFGGLAKSGGNILDFWSKYVKKSAEMGTASKVAEEGIKKAGIAAAETGAATAGATAASGGFIASLGSAALAAGPYVLAIARVAAAGYGVYRAYKAATDQTIPQVDLFADKVEQTSKRVQLAEGQTAVSFQERTIKISKSTKEAVSSYMKMDDSFKKTMMDIYIDADKFSNQTKQSVISQYTEMVNGAKDLSAGMKTDSINQFKQLVTQTGNLSKENVEKIIAQYTQMVNKVSGLSTQQKNTMIKNFRDTLTQSVGITQQQVNSIVQQITAMGTKIKTAMDKQNNDRYTKMKSFFDKSSALNAQDEQKILQNMQAYNNNKKQKITEYQAQITAIYQRASNNHRDLTEQEQQEVNSLQDKMRTNAVQSLSDNEIESKVILERMKSYGTSITEQQAQGVIKSANKQRHGAIAAANDQYDKTVAGFIYQRDVTHSLTADQADKLIADAGRQRDQSIQAAKDQRDQVVGHLTDMNKNVSSEIDTTTGDALGRYDKFIKSLSEKWKNLVEGIKKKWTDFKKWLSSLRGSGSSDEKIGTVVGGYIPEEGYASGTNNASPGWHIVGEEGPELYYFAGGETVIDANSTDNILKQVNKSNNPSGNDTGEQLKSTEEYGANLNKYFARGMENSVSSISKPLNTLESNINTLMTSLIQKYLDYGQQGNKNFGLGIEGSSASVINSIKALNSNIGNLAISFSQSFNTHGQNSMNNLGAGITGNENIVTNANTKVTTDNENILDDYSRAHTDYGTESMDNLDNAITGNESVVTNANTKVTTDNKAILSNYVQLHTTYGASSMNNLTAGINNGASNVLTATNKVSSDNKAVLNALAASANPIGQDVTNGLSAGMKSAEDNAVSIAHELTQKVIEAFTGPEGFDIHSPSKVTFPIGENVIQGFINGMSSKDVLTFFQNKIGAMIDYAQGASGQISQWLTAALGITGTPMSWLPGLIQLVKRESGSNPLAYNSISVGGEHATGLMQMLRSTFTENMMPGLNDILNPIANAASAIRYIKKRYGNVMNIPNLFSGNYIGYASGTTNAIAGWRIVGENGPELEYSAAGGETILNANDTSKILSIGSSGDAGKTIGASLVEGMADGIKSKVSLISNAMSNLGKAISDAFGNSLKKYDAWDEFKNELAKALNDNEVYINNSVVKLNTALANSVMNERNARSKYFEDYNKGAITADAAITRLDVDIKNLQTSTGDFETDTRNLLGVMTDQSTEINILTAEYNKLGNQYGYNSDKALDMLKKIQDVRDAYQKTGKDILDLVDNLKKSTIDDINEVSDKIKDALKQRYQDEQDAAEKQINLATDTQTKILQAKIDALDKQENALDIQYQDEDDADKEAELRRQLNMHYGAEKKKELQEELDELIKTRERRKQKEALDQQKDDLQKQIDQIKENSDQMIKNIEEFYADKLKDANIDAEAQKMIVNNNQSEIINLLKSYGKDYELAGSSLGDRLVAGLENSLSVIPNIISNLKEQINSLNTDINLSSISPTIVNTNNSVQTNNISLDAIKQATQQAVQSIVLVNKTILDGKQLSEGTTKYDNINQGYNLALAQRGL